MSAESALDPDQALETEPAPVQARKRFGIRAKLYTAFLGAASMTVVASSVSL